MVFREFGGPLDMRHLGKITTWKDEQGFGFITPRGGGQVFVHIKSFSTRRRRPAGNDVVSYDLVSDNQGRPRAEDVAFVDDLPDAASPNNRIPPLAFPSLFLGGVAALVFLNWLPVAVLGIYLAGSAVTLLVYKRDKSAAMMHRWRTSESTLLLLGLIGGWPGAVAAQVLLRHKSRKQSFQIAFWITVAVNCAGLLWILSPSGSQALRSWLSVF